MKFIPLIVAVSLVASPVAAVSTSASAAAQTPSAEQFRCIYARDSKFAADLQRLVIELDQFRPKPRTFWQRLGDAQLDIHLRIRNAHDRLYKRVFGTERVHDVTDIPLDRVELARFNRAQIQMSVMANRLWAAQAQQLVCK